ncbi:hypothetical protein [Clostridium ljungdahlii]|uniref:Uncharacterized protein n=1 Tax=Clostridium ljungdahlii TaxID=1538 RepID=A0A166RKT5_9CLOT|nr:hypothetical protein [Clostridium ljungdahlii]OAA90881.1 hypothetical protein WY13_00947 [Clostridium ljungdahlii]
MKINNYTVPFVVKMIQEIYKLDEQRFYKADLSASDLLMDLNLILSKINLTNKQAFILEKYWQEGYT